MEKEEIASLLIHSIPNDVSINQVEVLESAILLLADVINQFNNDGVIIDATKGMLLCEVNLFGQGRYFQLYALKNNFEKGTNRISKDRLTTIFIHSIPSGVSKGNALKGIVLFLALLIYQCKNSEELVPAVLRLLDIEIDRFKKGYNGRMNEPLITGCKPKDVTLPKPKNWPE